MLRGSAESIRANIRFLEEYRIGLDDVEAERIELSLAVQAMRLDYIARQLRRLEEATPESP